MSREELVEKVRQVFWPDGVRDSPASPAWEELSADEQEWSRQQFVAVLDAILPQVSTVEELEALPVGTKVVDGIDEAWELVADCGDWMTIGNEHLYGGRSILERGPLTVVWQPS